MNRTRFDLLEYQQLAREISYPDKLLKLWEEVCWLYERGFIGKYELDEMKATIWPILQYLCSLKKTIESALGQKNRAYSKS